MAVPERTKALHRARILRGECPLCGGEAAPYRLCYDCRQKARFSNALKRGAKVGALTIIGEGRNKLYGLGVESEARWGSTPLHLPETDGRTRPRLRGISVDVEATLVEVMKLIGRPCTLEEIMAAWGRLRDRRSAPLANDLSRIIKAADRRTRRLAKAAAIHARNAERGVSS